MVVTHYGELTWPEVAALPRQIPLLVPLGLSEYDLAEVGRRLKVDQLVLLPAIPFGFRGDPGDALADLAVDRRLLRRVFRGVQRELATQGFTRVLFLDGFGVRRGIDTKGLAILEVAHAGGPSDAEWWGPRGRWPDDLSETLVIISTGHTEQHGHHLPIATDTLIVEAIARGIAGDAVDRVLCLPAWPYGVSTHTRQFPATLSLSGRTFEDFFVSMVGRLTGLGAKMIFISNAHGGNHSFLVNVVKYAGERWPEAFVATEFLHTTGPALERYRQTARGGMGHGCELETSYILHLRPDLVHMDRATAETDFISTPNYYMDWIEGGRLIANPPWTDDTTSGIYGDAKAATAEKGRVWLASAVEEKLAILQEVREQHQRRSARRSAR